MQDLQALYQYVGTPYNPGDDPLIIALQNGDVFTISILYNAFEQYHALGRLCDSSGHSTTKLHLMRVGSDGSSSDVVVNQWKESHSNLKTFVPDSFPVILRQNRLQSGPRIEFNGFYLITNADQGALFSWQVVKQCYPDDWIQTDPNCPQGGENHLTLSVGGGALDNVVDPVVPNQSGPFQPILQLADGSYIGTVSNSYMLSFDTLGGVQWMVPGYTPRMATADGGIIATDSGSFDFVTGTFLQSAATTFDSSGTPTAQLANSPQFRSWIGKAYQAGSLEQVTSSNTRANPRAIPITSKLFPAFLVIWGCVLFYEAAQNFRSFGRWNNVAGNMIEGVFFSVWSLLLIFIAVRNLARPPRAEGTANQLSWHGPLDGRYSAKSALTSAAKLLALSAFVGDHR